MAAWFEIGLEMFLHHGRREQLVPSVRKCGKDRRHIKVTRVIWSKDDGRLYSLEMLESPDSERQIVSIERQCNEMLKDGSKPSNGCCPCPRRQWCFRFGW